MRLFIYFIIVIIISSCLSQKYSENVVVYKRKHTFTNANLYYALDLKSNKYYGLTQSIRGEGIYSFSYGTYHKLDNPDEIVVNSLSNSILSVDTVAIGIEFKKESKYVAEIDSIIKLAKKDSLN